ncbi:hypothetical protein AB0O57_02390 [Streptomyces sp. NPDC091201]|uniref:hypothetical protein n=1 Tax=Streptomyces sp. NPDC091201 TaxID=3155190 RepID=UPI003428C3AB
MKLSPRTAPVEPDNLLIRFHNQIGAAVDVTSAGARVSWSCHGCGGVDSYTSLNLTREYANGHAASCRAAYHRLR